MWTRQLDNDQRMNSFIGEMTTSNAALAAARRVNGGSRGPSTYRPTVPPVFSGKAEDAGTWRARMQQWGSAAMERGVPGKEVLGAYMDTALTPPTNSQSLLTWLGGAGTMDLEKAVGTTDGGGARAEAVRKVLAANPTMTYERLTEAGWKEVLAHLYNEFTCKYGERPASMIARLGELRFQGKGHEDEKGADYCRRAVALYEQYVETNQALGSVPVYGTKR